MTLPRLGRIQKMRQRRGGVFLTVGDNGVLVPDGRQWGVKAFELTPGDGILIA